jgi:hypothetical protein
MTFSEELRHTLQTMGFVQMLLVLLFLGAYVMALSGLTGPVGRQRAGAMALGAAVGFAAVTPAWATGAMLMVLAIGGVGLFVAGVLALDRFSASRTDATLPNESGAPGHVEPDLSARTERLARPGNGIPAT